MEESTVNPKNEAIIITIHLPSAKCTRRKQSTAELARQVILDNVTSKIDEV